MINVFMIRTEAEIPFLTAQIYFTCDSNGTIGNTIT